MNKTSSKTVILFRALVVVLLPILLLNSCDIFSDERWHVSVAVEAESLVVTTTIANVHGDFIHMSIRKKGHDNQYTIERSPAPSQENRDWSRVHHWFMELNPDTYLEGRIDDGGGTGPQRFRTYEFRVPREAGLARGNYPDINGTDYMYITLGYGYADGNYTHPPFAAGEYEIQIYAWYTGWASWTHPSIDDSPKVQYVHYEHPLATFHFTIP